MSNTTVSSLPGILSAIQFRMSTITMPLLLVFGSGGNILNACILLQKTFRASSCSMYMIAAYVFHTVVLSFAMSTSLYSLFNVDPLTYSVPYCKMRQYLISAVITTARCCVGMACVDRYAISSQHVHIRALGKPRVARYAIGTIFVAWLILPIHLIVFNNIQNKRCMMSGDYPYFFAAYAIIIAAIIPPGMMVTFGILAARNIRRIRQRVQPLPGGRDPIHNVAANNKFVVRLKPYDYQLLRMLLIDITIYCISAVPAPIYYVYAAITLRSMKSADHVAWQNFLNYLAYQVLLYIAASTSFYTNFLVSKAFRDEFRSFIRRFLLRQPPMQINNLSAATNNPTHPPHRLTMKKDP